jgi:hypothetical protein
MVLQVLILLKDDFISTITFGSTSTNIFKGYFVFALFEFLMTVYLVSIPFNPSHAW